MVSPLVRLFILSQQHSNRGDTKLQSANENMAVFFNDYNREPPQVLVGGATRY
jgi:hypothetical protein